MRRDVLDARLRPSAAGPSEVTPKALARRSKVPNRYYSTCAANQGAAIRMAHAHTRGDRAFQPVALHSGALCPLAAGTRGGAFGIRPGGWGRPSAENHWWAATRGIPGLPPVRDMHTFGPRTVLYVCMYVCTQSNRPRAARPRPCTYICTQLLRGQLGVEVQAALVLVGHTGRGGGI